MASVDPAATTAPTPSIARAYTLALLPSSGRAMLGDATSPPHAFKTPIGFVATLASHLRVIVHTKRRRGGVERRQKRS
eukprot:24425-Pelagococcus_subviridis.AAC.1